MTSIISNFTTFANVARTGSDQNWGDESNAQTSNNLYASAGNPIHVDGVTAIYHYLKASQLVSRVPERARILGIKLYIERAQDSPTGPAGGCVDLEVYIVKNGSIVTLENKALAGAWGTTETTVSYGGATDLWGTTWSANQINSAGFGFVLAVTANGGDDGEGGFYTADPLVDHMYAEIFYEGSKSSPPNQTFEVPIEMDYHKSALAGGFRAIDSERITSLSSSTQIFANCPDDCTTIELTVRTQGITLTKDGKAATASGIGNDYATGTYMFSGNAEEFKRYRAIQQTASAEIYITYLKPA